eukprot:TRINITY_DN12428_c0_g1_i2.p1 TRINITY_DN12428_c0_g1~~TRINITY_DN12428_c0_g1_i2.p1  ORF type:complete len:569 (-),score=77.17 TRINITY_DN12428_c0_g1_i2:102-1742(-)
MLLEEKLVEMRKALILAKAAVTRERERIAAESSRTATLADPLAQAESSGLNQNGEDDQANAEMADSECMRTQEEGLSHIESSRPAKTRQAQLRLPKRSDGTCVVKVKSEPQHVEVQEKVLPQQGLEQEDKQGRAADGQNVRPRRRITGRSCFSESTPSGEKQASAEGHGGDDGQGCDDSGDRSRSAGEDIAVQVVKKRLLVTSVQTRIWSKKSCCMQETITETRFNTNTKSDPKTKVGSRSVNEKRETMPRVRKSKALGGRRKPADRQSGVWGVKFDKQKTRWIASFWQNGELIIGRFQHTKYLDLCKQDEDAAIEMAMKDAIAFRQRGPASGVGGYAGNPVVPCGKALLAIESAPSGNDKTKHNGGKAPLAIESAPSGNDKTKHNGGKAPLAIESAPSGNDKTKHNNGNSVSTLAISRAPSGTAKRSKVSKGKRPNLKNKVMAKSLKLKVAKPQIVANRSKGLLQRSTSGSGRTGSAPVSNLQSGVTGVHWDGCRACWRPYIHHAGKMIRAPSVRPKNLSKQEIEKARLIAVKHRSDLERKYNKN